MEKELTADPQTTAETAPQLAKETEDQALARLTEEAFNDPDNEVIKIEGDPVAYLKNLWK